MRRLAILDQHYQSMGGRPANTYASPRAPDLTTLVLHFFCGAEVLSDAEQYASGAPLGTVLPHGVTSLLETVRGVDRGELLEAVNLLEASGRLQRVSGEGEPSRFRAVPAIGGPLEDLVMSFFCFTGQDAPEVGHTLTELHAWGRGIPASQVEFMEAIEELVGRGDIYSTIDDDHFLPTV